MNVFDGIRINKKNDSRFVKKLILRHHKKVDILSLNALEIKKRVFI